MNTWQFCDRDLFGMVSSRDPNSRVVGDLQLGDEKVTLNHLVDGLEYSNLSLLLTILWFLVT